MKYYIKEKLIAFGAKFDVYDSNDNIIYVAEADKFDIGKNINLYDIYTNTRVIYMRQKLRLFGHKYVAYDNSNREIAIIEKELMVPKYYASGRYGEIVMESDSIMGRHYEIKNNGVLIGRIDKDFNLFGRDKYLLEVYDEQYSKFLIALAIMVDMVRFHNN